MGLTSVFKMTAGKQLAFPATSLLGGVVLQRKLLHGALLAVRAQEPALQACGRYILSWPKLTVKRFEHASKCAGSGSQSQIACKLTRRVPGSASSSDNGHHGNAATASKRLRRTHDAGERLADDGDQRRVPGGGRGPRRPPPPPRRLAQPQHAPLQRQPVPRLHPLIRQRRLRHLPDHQTRTHRCVA